MESYEPLAAELADFIEAVRSTQSLDWAATLGNNVVRIAEAADQSLTNGGDEIVLSERRSAALGAASKGDIAGDPPAA